MEYKVAVDVERVERAIVELLDALGENRERDGLKETPRRVAKWWKEFMEFDAGHIETTFDCVSSGQMVLVSGMRVWSLCEHHLLPFWCDVAIGYLPKTRMLGLSKFGRIAHAVAHKLQVQERLCDEIASLVARVTQSDDVMVLTRGEHLCMTMRGIRTPSAMTTTTARGIFETSAELRREFLEAYESGY